MLKYFSLLGVHNRADSNTLCTEYLIIDIIIIKATVSGKLVSAPPPASNLVTAQILSLLRILPLIRHSLGVFLITFTKSQQFLKYIH